MTTFETVGVNYQYEANSIYEANKAFQYSCTCCCSKGINTPCDRCAIAYTHDLICTYFDDKK